MAGLLRSDSAPSGRSSPIARSSSPATEMKEDVVVKRQLAKMRRGSVSLKNVPAGGKGRAGAAAAAAAGAGAGAGAAGARPEDAR
jgi:hypothetical protein